MIGLEKDIVVLCRDHNEWKQLFSVERQLILNCIGEYIVEVQHVGSTAIPGLLAKPIIDILVGIKSLQDSDILKEKLEEAGYYYIIHAGDPERLFFSKGEGSRQTFHLHAQEYDSKGWWNQILFRDYLMQQEGRRLQYEKLKITLSQKYSENRPLYTAGKDGFIKETLKAIHTHSLVTIEYSAEHYLDLYLRAVNYITVSHLFLKDNILLERKLCEEDIKTRLTGHWGTSPNINFIITHLQFFIKRYRFKAMVIIGAGHAASALMANLYLDGTLMRYYPELSLDEDGLLNFINFDTIVRSEISPQMPGTLYDGGELGYSLPVGYGAALDNKKLIVFVVIGDGEAETGTISASWITNKYLNQQRDGVVVPIINLNGFSMGNRSHFSLMSDAELTQYFNSLNYETIITNANHSNMIQCMERIKQLLQKLENGECVPYPLVILKCTKGIGAPNYQNTKIAGTLESHKMPLTDIQVNSQTREYLYHWLKHYRFDEIFDSHSGFVHDVFHILPDNNLKVTSCNLAYGEAYNELILPDCSDYELNFRTVESYRNVCVLDAYIRDIIRVNDNFRIVSPDELKSNGFNQLTELKGRSLASQQVMEILNENICQAWMQGYIRTGRHCLMISYEAFMPVVTSMISQCCKFIYQCSKLSWRTPTASFNYILTSVCWANTYSHQNPEFITSLMSKEYPFTNTYFPYDANCLLVCVEQCLKSKNQVNAIISTKIPIRQYGSVEDGKAAVRKGYQIIGHPYWAPDKKIDILLVAIGDHMVNECFESVEILHSCGLRYNIRLVAIVDLSILRTDRDKSLSENEFQQIFIPDIPCVVAFHGYPSVVKMLLYDRNFLNNVTVMGYRDKSDISSGSIEKMTLNHASRYDIALDILSKVQGGAPAPSLVKNAIIRMRNMTQEWI